MIVDWAENCTKIFRTGRLSDADEFDRVHKLKQEIVYLRFLFDCQKFTSDQIYQEWINISNGTADKYKDNPNTLRLQFQRLWELSTRITRVNYQQRLRPINIYQGEIDFLNRLDVPLWVKQYWCALLVYYKFSVQISQYVHDGSDVNSWAIRQTNYADHRYGSSCQDRIAQFRQRLKIPVIQEDVMAHPISGKVYDSTPVFHPLFLCTSGNIAISIATIDETPLVISLCKPIMLRCTMCGADYEKSSKTQRNVCANCYPKLRRLKDAARKRKKYHENKNILDVKQE